MADSGFPSFSSSVDVSSYKQPQQPGFTDIIKGYQGVESNKLAIDKQKLDLVNQHYQNMISDLVSLGPNPTPDQIQQAATNQVKLGRIPANMAATFIASVPTDPAKIPDFMQAAIGKLMSVNEATQWHYGERGSLNTGQTIQPTLTSPKPGFGVRPNGLPVQIQPPPTTEVRGESGPQMLGPQAPQLPVNKLPVAGGLPGQYQDAPITPNPVRTVPMRASPLPVAPPQPNPMAVPPIDNRPASFNERWAPTGPPTGMAPGVAEARAIDAKGSADTLNADRGLTVDRLTGIVPLKQALALLPGITTGIGTEPYNKARAALVNAGLISADANDPTVIYQEINKKMRQYISGSAVGQTDQGRALTQSSNPDPVGQLNPALIKLSRDAIALDRSNALRALTYEGKPEDYNKHRTSFPQTIDQRALSIDTLQPNERDALLADMKKKANTKEGQKFWKTLEMADKHNILD